jgi:hypothetical protein
MGNLQSFVERHAIRPAQFTAIGALSDAALMYFDWQKKNYLRTFRFASRSRSPR